MVSPINSVKHYVAKTNTAIASGGLVSEFAVKSVLAPATAAAFEVPQGSVVKAVHFEVWICGDALAGNTSQFVFAIEKSTGGQTAMTVTNMLNLGVYLNKKNILFTSQGVLGTTVDGNQSIPVFRGWILIPKGKQRMGLDDSIRWHVTAVGDLRVCGLITYKDYR